MGAETLQGESKGDIKDMPGGDKKKVELSYSRIHTYRFCPVKFRLIYELGWKERLSSQSSLGLSLHRALEQFHKEGGSTLESLFGSLDEHWVNSGFESVQDSYECYDTARDILERYFKRWQEEKGEIIFLEKEFMFSEENYVLKGIIDRIDRTPEGFYEVIDYKTRVRPSDRNGHDSSLQLGIYYLACERILGELPGRMSFLCLTTGNKVSKKFDAQNKTEVLAILKDTAKKMENGEFTPDLSKCEACNFSDKCKKK